MEGLHHFSGIARHMHVLPFWWWSSALLGWDWSVSMTCDRFIFCCVNTCLCWPLLLCLTNITPALPWRSLICATNINPFAVRCQASSLFPAVGRFSSSRIPKTLRKEGKARFFNSRSSKLREKNIISESNIILHN